MAFTASAWLRTEENTRKPAKMNSSNLCQADSGPISRISSRPTVLADPKQRPGSNPVHRENPRKAVFPRHLRGGRTSSDVIPTATIIMAITYGLGSNDHSPAGGSQRPTRRHRDTKHVACQTRRFHPFRENTLYFSLFRSLTDHGRHGGGSPNRWSHQGNPARRGRCRTGRPPSGLVRGSPP